MRYAERRRACKQIIRITFIHNISVIISPFPFPNVDICTFFRGANGDVRKDQNVGAHIIWKLLKMSHFSWFQLSINSNCFKKCNENQMNLAKFSRNYFVWYKTPSSHFKRNVWHLFDWKVSSNVIHILENIVGEKESFVLKYSSHIPTTVSQSLEEIGSLATKI